MSDQLDRLPLSASELYWLRENWPEDANCQLRFKPIPQADGVERWTLTAYHFDGKGKRTHSMGFWSAAGSEHFFPCIRYLVRAARKRCKLTPATEWID